MLFTLKIVSDNKGSGNSRSPKVATSENKAENPNEQCPTVNTEADSSSPNKMDESEKIEATNANKVDEVDKTENEDKWTEISIILHTFKMFVVVDIIHILKCKIYIETVHSNLLLGYILKKTYFKSYGSDQSDILPNWLPHGGIILAKGQLNHSYTIWTVSILIFSPVANLLPHPLGS